MTHRQSPAAGQRPAGVSASPKTARLALAAVLTGAVVAGAQAAVPAADWNQGPWHGHGLLLAAGLEAVLVTLLVLLGRRDRRFATSPLAARVHLLLRTALVIGVTAVPVLVVLNITATTPLHLPPLLVPKPRPASATPAAPPPAVFGMRAALVPALYIGLLTALIASAAVLLLSLLRAQPSGAVPADPSPAGEEERLRRAVRSGQAALAGLDDARRAIIACYLAMEDSLARAGTVRGEAETPDELLARAAATGLAQRAEAGELTALFYEARFSTRPMPPGRRAAARRALAALAAGPGADSYAGAAGAAGGGHAGGGAAR